MAVCLPAMALEKHVFKSADKTKSFEGVVTDYDAKRETVTIRKTRGRSSTMKLAQLCEEDVTYVKEQGPAIAAAKAIQVDFDLWKDKPETNKTKSERTVTTPAGYEIELRNMVKKDISDIEVRYTIFHRKDAENGPGSIKQSKGSFYISTLFANSDDTNRTDPVDLVRYSRQKAGGG